MSSYDGGRIQITSKVPLKFHAAMEQAGHVRDDAPGWSVKMGRISLAVASDEQGARDIQAAFRAAGLQGPTTIEEN